MGTPPATIDLGVYSYRSAPDAPPQRRWPARAQLARWRQLGAAVVVAALAGGLAGSAAPSPPRLTLLWTLPAGPHDQSNVAAGAADLYAITSAEAGPALTAYRLADGAVRWVAPLAAPDAPWPAGSDPWIAVIDGVPVVHTFDGVGRTAAYDPDRAQIRWTSQGLPEYVGGGMVGLRTFSVEDPDVATVSLEVRDMSSGAVAATLDDPQGYDYREAPGGGIHVFTLDQYGLLSSYDLATGAAVGTVSTPYADSPAGARRSTVRVAGGVVVVAGEIGAADTLTAYDAGTLEQLWSAPGGQLVYACGPVLCVGGFDGPLRGVAPQTGALRWSTSCADLGVRGECAMLLPNLGAGDRLVLQLERRDRRRGEPPVQHVVLDAATGQLVTDPTQWALGPSGSGLLLSRGEGVPSEQAEYWREDDIEPHLIWWARSDLDLDRVEVLGAVEADWCSAHNPYLVCHTASGAVEVWRIRK